MFCPQAVEWGDVATWVSGFGTLAAVIVAMYLAYRARAREEDRRAREAMARKENAMRFVLAFDYELHQLEWLLALFGGCATRALDQNGTPLKVIELVDSKKSSMGLPLMMLQVDRFDMFDREVGAKLAICLSGFMQMENGLTTPFEPRAFGTEIAARARCRWIQTHALIVWRLAREAREAFRVEKEIQTLISTDLPAVPNWISIFVHDEASAVPE